MLLFLGSKMCSNDYHTSSSLAHIPLAFSISAGAVVYVTGEIWTENKQVEQSTRKDAIEQSTNPPRSALRHD